MNNGISLVDDDIQTFSGDDDLFEQYDLNIEIHTRNDDAQLIKQQILNNQAIVEKLDEQLKDLERFQPEIKRRKKGLLNMCDAVDTIRDNEYGLLKSIRNTIQTECLTEKSHE